MAAAGMNKTTTTAVPTSAVSASSWCSCFNTATTSRCCRVPDDDDGDGDAVIVGIVPTLFPAAILLAMYEHLTWQRHNLAQPN